MASIRKGWRMAVVAGAAALALALVTSAFAQAPPAPDHAFYGSAAAGSGATIDGEPAPDGTVVTATNQDGEAVGSSTISGGVWMINVGSDNASVTFAVNGIAAEGSHGVTSGEATAVTLAVTTAAEEPEEPEEPVVEPVEPPAEPVAPETPAGLPNTGSGGLADTSGGFPLLPVALVISALVALGGVAVTRRAGIGAR